MIKRQNTLQTQLTKIQMIINLCNTEQDVIHIKNNMKKHLMMQKSVFHYILILPMGILERAKF